MAGSETNEQDEQAEIAAFRDALIDDIYAPRDFLPWPEIEAELQSCAPGLALLRSVAVARNDKPKVLAQALLEAKSVFDVVLHLLAAPRGVGFGDGRRIPEQAPRTEAEALATARLLLDLGLERIVSDRTELADLLRVSLIGADARRRGFRRRDTLRALLSTLIDQAVRSAGDELGRTITSSDVGDLPPVARRRVTRVLAAEGKPFAAVATAFEAIHGGRQFQSMRQFMQVQDELDALSIGLIVIADGRGVKAVPETIITEVWERVGALVSIRQAERGDLAAAIVGLYRGGGASRGTNLPVDRLISAMLEEQASVVAEDLPVSEEAARLALARYEAEHTEQALVLSGRTGELTWQRSDIVGRIDSLRRSFQPAHAVAVARSLFGAEPGSSPVSGDDVSAVIDTPQNPLLPSQMYVGARAAEPTVGLVREIALDSRERVIDASLAVLVVPDAQVWLDHPERELTMRTTSTSVIVIDPTDLRHIAGAASSPQETLAEYVLRQADLTKASPFVHNGVTPDRVFAGRSGEEASIVAHVGSSSVALIGSRRIGKTSLMRRVRDSLAAQGRTVYYGDCQAIGDWAGFARMARRRWDVELAATFDPDQLAEMVSKLRVGADAPVFILDEVDRLIDWDQRNVTDGVPEAFFRSFRALSQVDDAQFVFSGERTFADRLWSADSPHWNFCQRIVLRQLGRASAASLLFDVLGFLAVRFDDRHTAEGILWEATSGHPRLVQLLGDKLVKRLNDRPQDQRGTLSTNDLQLLIESFDYKREYLETYWGQATPYERQLGQAVAAGRRDVASLQAVADGGDLGRALRVLELYGIVDVSEDSVDLRATYLPTALHGVGPETTGEARGTK